MDNLLPIALLLALAAVSIALFTVMRNRPAPVAASPADPAADAANRDAMARIEATMRGLIEQSNRDREAVQKVLGDGQRDAQQLFQQVGERLVRIDSAQAKIGELQLQVTDLVGILGNKQARGAFGEMRLESIVEDVLPPSLYEFQATLSTGTRVDCLIRLGGESGAVAVDSKFPLEGYRAYAAAADDATRAAASREFTTAVRKHIDDIAAKYIVPGETRELAVMFIPAESIFSDLIDRFEDLRSYAYRKRVYFTSPNTLHGMLTSLKSIYINTRIAEQAGLIKDEVVRILDDIGRLDDRVESLERHFDQASRDIKEIRTSASKIAKRGDAIRGAELDAGEEPDALGAGDLA